ncbi:MAG TPA: phospho-N-acetylmuramoyl-pentapeptide-transferase [Armatimonadota bacterium]|jgi:phospho-N-acetylmuramoyl-pentapeptide-transferase
MPSTHSIYILLAAMLLSFLVTFLLSFPVIAYLRAKKLGQQIREEGPQRHLNKAGTPTMGGVVILVGLFAGTVGSWYFFPKQFWFSVLLLALFVAMAAIGSIDDWGKIKRGRSLGLRAREKLILQFIVSSLFVAGLVLGLDNGTTIGIPFLRHDIQLGWWYWPLAILYLAGISNAVNLTDGLDGLAAGTSMASSFALAGVAWYLRAGQAMAQGEAVATFAACLGAACFAFLWFNQHPAKVFMGDTGSLAIGAALAGTALILKQEVLLLLIGFVFVIEISSVIIQVIVFKLTGKRVFRMSPFHHHLELSGWSEPKIVQSAWLLGILLAFGGFWVARLWGLH